MSRRMWYVYILKSQIKKWYYVGSTNDLNRRIDEHNNGKVSSTKHNRPYSFVFAKEFIEENEARNYERKLKDCRLEKEKIIKNIK